MKPLVPSAQDRGRSDTAWWRCTASHQRVSFAAPPLSASPRSRPRLRISLSWSSEPETLRWLTAPHGVKEDSRGHYVRSLASQRAHEVGKTGMVGRDSPQREASGNVERRGLPGFGEKHRARSSSRKSMVSCTVTSRTDSLPVCRRAKPPDRCEAAVQEAYADKVPSTRPCSRVAPAIDGLKCPLASRAGAARLGPALALAERAARASQFGLAAPRWRCM